MWNKMEVDNLDYVFRIISIFSENEFLELNGNISI